MIHEGICISTPIAGVRYPVIAIGFLRQGAAE